MTARASSDDVLTAKEKKKKIDKWNFIKGKKCCFSKTVFSKQIGKLQRGKTYLPNIYQMKTNIQDPE